MLKWYKFHLHGWAPGKTQLNQRQPPEFTCQLSGVWDYLDLVQKGISDFPQISVNLREMPFRPARTWNEHKLTWFSQQED